jgi:hypothetical protein
MPFEEGLLALVRKGHHEGQRRVTERQHHVLGSELLAGDDHLASPKSNWASCPGLNSSGMKVVRRRTQPIIDAMRRMLLLAWLLAVCQQPLVDHFPCTCFTPLTLSVRP